MRALLEDVRQVVLSFGREPLQDFTRNLSSAITFMDTSAYPLEAVIDEILERRYKLVEALTFSDPGDTGNVRLRFFTESAPDRCLPHMAFVLDQIRALGKASPAMQLRKENFSRKPRHAGQYRLRMHVMPRGTPVPFPEIDHYVASATG